MKYVANPVEVEAAVITAVSVFEVDDSGTSYTIQLSGYDGASEMCVGPEMTARYKPVVGDYLVRQSDGYIYLNPKDVFERKYSPKPLDALQLGAAARAAGIVV